MILTTLPGCKASEVLPSAIMVNEISPESDGLAILSIMNIQE